MTADYAWGLLAFLLQLLDIPLAIGSAYVFRLKGLKMYTKTTTAAAAAHTHTYSKRNKKGLIGDVTRTRFKSQVPH